VSSSARAWAARSDTSPDAAGLVAAGSDAACAQGAPNSSVASESHAAHIGPDTNPIALTPNVRSDATRIGVLAKAEATATAISAEAKNEVAQMVKTFSAGGFLRWLVNHLAQQTARHDRCSESWRPGTSSACPAS
jgi:hypothetical protein